GDRYLRQRCDNYCLLYWRLLQHPTTKHRVAGVSAPRRATRNSHRAFFHILLLYIDRQLPRTAHREAVRAETTIKFAYTVCRILSFVMSGANAWCQSASRGKTSSPALIV